MFTALGARVTVVEVLRPSHFVAQPMLSDGYMWSAHNV
jgi:hypothetical protein